MLSAEINAREEDDDGKVDDEKIHGFS